MDKELLQKRKVTVGILAVRLAGLGAELARAVQTEPDEAYSDKELASLLGAITSGVLNLVAHTVARCQLDPLTAFAQMMQELENGRPGADAPAQNAPTTSTVN